MYSSVTHIHTVHTFTHIGTDKEEAPDRVVSIYIHLIADSYIHDIYSKSVLIKVLRSHSR